MVFCRVIGRVFGRVFGWVFNKVFGRVFGRVFIRIFDLWYSVVHYSHLLNWMWLSPAGEVVPQ